VKHRARFFGASTLAFGTRGSSRLGRSGLSGTKRILPPIRDGAARFRVPNAVAKGTSSACGDKYHIHLHGIAGNADDVGRSAGQIGRQVSGAIIGARRYG